MTSTDPDITAELKRLDLALERPRDLARQAVAEFRLDREKDKQKPLPVATTHDIHGAPLLDVRAVEVRARPDYAPNVSDDRRRQSLLRWLLRRR